MVIRVRADRRRSRSAIIGLATIDRKSVARSARERSKVLWKKLGVFAKALMLSFGDLDEARWVSSPYLGKHGQKAKKGDMT